MLEFFSGAFSQYDDRQLVTHWDDPVVRKRADGTIVAGRPTRGYGDGGTFSYAGKDYHPEFWTSPMMGLKHDAEQFVFQQTGKLPNFTFCLAGLYPTGADGIPFHSDTVPTLDDLVLSISFGDPRVFTNRKFDCDIKEHSNTSDVVDMEDIEAAGASWFDYNYLMQHGDAILFDGRSQMTSMHEVPPVIGPGCRTNFTFRTGL